MYKVNEKRTLIQNKENGITGKNLKKYKCPEIIKLGKMQNLTKKNAGSQMDFQGWWDGVS